MEYTYREYSSPTNNFYKKVWEELSIVSVNGKMTKQNYMNLYSYYKNYYLIKSECDHYQEISRDMISILLKYLKHSDRIDDQYKSIITDDFKEKFVSTLINVELPGKHLVLGIIGYFIFNLNILPQEFSSNIRKINEISDGNYNLPLTVDKMWKNTGLVQSFNSIVENYQYPLLSNQNTLLSMDLDSKMDHILRNVIKMRLIAKGILDKKNGQVVEATTGKMARDYWRQIKEMRQKEKKPTAVIDDKKRKQLLNQVLNLRQVFVNLINNNEELTMDNLAKKILDFGGTVLDDIKSELDPNSNKK